MQTDQFIPRDSIVALPTPFRGGTLAYDLLAVDVMRHRLAGTNALLIAGTTGEGAALSEAERIATFRTACNAARNQIKVICAVGTNDTRVSLRLARAARECGADAVMAIVPYYNRPQARGLEAHFSAIAQVVPNLSLTLYDVPTRTACELPLDVIQRLAAQHKNITSIKLACTDLDRVELLVRESGLQVLCGEDRLILEFLRRGAVGAVSVLGNVMPRETSALIQAGRRTPDAPRARSLAARLTPLAQALFVETNPVPVKAALAVLEGYPSEVRLPLVGLEADNRRMLEDVLQRLVVTAQIASKSLTPTV
jgi:4-hydroxy-tetrahydrodipicolinate synthase